MVQRHRPAALAREVGFERLRLVFLQQLGDAEVEQHRLPFGRDQHVVGFQVAVDHQVGVGVLHRLQHLLQQLHAASHVEPAFVAVGGDRLAFDVLERQVGLAIVGQAGVVQPRDVRVGQAAEDVALALEALHQHAAPRMQQRQLERHAALQLAIGAFGQPDLAHAAAAQLVQQPVRADRCARRELGGALRAGGRRGELRQAVDQVTGFAGRLLGQQFTQGRRQPQGFALQRSDPGLAIGRQQIEGLLEQVGQRAQFVGLHGPLHTQSRSQTGHKGRSGRGERGEEQQPRLLPVASHGAFGQVERLRDLGFGEAAEVAHLDHLAQARVGLAQLLERFVDAQHVVFGRRGAGGDARVQHHVHGIAAAPLGLARAREIDDHRAHHPRGIGEEMMPVLDRQSLRASQAQIRFVDQGGGVEQGHLLVASQLGMGQAAQLFVEQAESLARSFTVALAGGPEKVGQ